MRKNIFQRGLHQAMLVQYTAVKTIQLVFSGSQSALLETSYQMWGSILTRETLSLPQSTAWRQTLNIVLNGQPWVTMTTASGKVSTVPLGKKNVVQGQTRRLWRSQILFLSQSCHWTAAKIWAYLGQMSLPASSVWVPPGLPVSVLSILDKRGSSISRKVQELEWQPETPLKFPGSCPGAGWAGSAAALLPEGRIKSTGGEKEQSPMSPSKSSSDPWASKWTSQSDNAFSMYPRCSSWPLNK